MGAPDRGWERSPAGQVVAWPKNSAVKWLWRPTRRPSYVEACWSPLDRPLPPGERPGGTAPWQVQGALFLRLSSQPASHLVQHCTLVRRETLEPGRRDLVEHAIKLNRTCLATGAHGGHHSARAGALLCRNRLALGHDLIHFVALRARAGERPRDG